MPRISRANVRILLQRTFIVSCFFLFFVAIIHIIYYKHIKKLQNTHALYLPTHLFVLIDEAAQRGVLVANLPPLVDDDSHEHQHDHYHSGGEGYTEDDFYFHTLCGFDFTLQRYGKLRRQVSRSYKSLSQFRKTCISGCLMV